jgi:hypothetical protein
MVFNLASNFEFSTASISTTSLCSGGDVDAAVGEGGNLCFTGFAAIGGVALSLHASRSEDLGTVEHSEAWTTAPWPTETSNTSGNNFI